MEPPMTVRPFTDRLNSIRQDNRYRYADLEAKSDRVRSTAWFNNLINGGTWAVSPPPRDTWSGLASLLETSVDDVRRIVAEEWFEVPPPEKMSSRVAALRSRLDDLSDEDAGLVEALVQRLTMTSPTPAAT